MAYLEKLALTHLLSRQPKRGHNPSIKSQWKLAATMSRIIALVLVCYLTTSLLGGGVVCLQGKHIDPSLCNLLGIDTKTLLQIEYTATGKALCGRQSTTHKLGFLTFNTRNNPRAKLKNGHAKRRTGNARTQSIDTLIVGFFLIASATVSHTASTVLSPTTVPLLQQPQWLF